MFLEKKPRRKPKTHQPSSPPIPVQVCIEDLRWVQGAGQPDALLVLVHRDQQAADELLGGSEMMGADPGAPT